MKDSMADARRGASLAPRRAGHSAPARIGLGALAASTYFMVSGGPYGVEELVQRAGFGMALVVIAITPIVWSLPTSLMVGELAAAIPDEGGYYVWVKRSLGPFWGFQEAWLSMAAAVFDIGIYPALFAAYVARLVPSLAAPGAELAVRAAVLVACVGWNTRGARSVGRGAEVLALVLLAPFVVFSALAFARGGSHPDAQATGDVFGGVLVAMWNTMGWDNASTIAGEVHRPQRTYPLAMLLTVALVVVTYVVPIAAAWAAGIDPSELSTGGWADAARHAGGSALGAAVVIGGMLSSVGMLTALAMSYSRVPMVLAEDGYLPPILARRDARGVPFASLLLCGVLFSLSLALSFERLILLDILLYGMSLILEFAALVVLRVREPTLHRPFRVPFGVPGCVALAVGPVVLLGAAFCRNFDERIAGVRSLWIAAVAIAMGPVAYGAARLRARVAARARSLSPE
jgi:amino acid transporter